MTSFMSNGPAQLDYAKRLPVWNQRRWRRSLIVMAVIAFSALAAWWGWSSAPGDWARSAYWQHRCEYYSSPPGLPVYSTDPAIVPTMRASGPNCLYSLSNPTDAMICPDEWQKVNQLEIDSGTGVSAGMDGLIFLHRRSQPSGKSRLVSVHISVWCQGTNFTDATSTGPAVAAGQKVAYATLQAEVFRRDAGHYISLTNAMTLIIQPLSEQFSLYGGTPAPADPSRFTIGYTLRGQPGAIEGQLKDDDTVILQVLSGSLTLFEKDPPFVARARVSRPASNASP